MLSLLASPIECCLDKRAPMVGALTLPAFAALLTDLSEVLIALLERTLAADSSVTPGRY